MTTVMIVDDDRTTVSLLQTLLELDGFDVMVVPQGTQVIDRAEVKRPDIILMDYNLADTTGVHVLKELRAHTQLNAIPVIIASGMDMRDEVMAAGAQEFLIKPFEPGDLPALFNRLIGS